MLTSSSRVTTASRSRTIQKTVQLRWTYDTQPLRMKKRQLRHHTSLVFKKYCTTSQITYYNHRAADPLLWLSECTFFCLRDSAHCKLLRVQTLQRQRGDFRIENTSWTTARHRVLWRVPPGRNCYPVIEFHLNQMRHQIETKIVFNMVICIGSAPKASAWDIVASVLDFGIVIFILLFEKNTCLIYIYCLCYITNYITLIHSWRWNVTT